MVNALLVLDIEHPAPPGRIILPRHRMLSPGVARVMAKQAGWLD
jgi:hypothetical protein